MSVLKYRVLIDYGSYEGMKFASPDEFATVDDAVKFAINNSCGSPFLIINVVEWVASETPDA